MGDFVSEPQLVQLRFRSEPWKLLVCCILLNRAQRKQVDQVVDQLFLDYPTVEDLADARLNDLRDLLYPLGLSRVRAQRLIAFAKQWLELPALVENSVRSVDELIDAVSALPGVGRYALDSYRLFVLGQTWIHPTDKQLLRWLRWYEVTHGSA